jgi:hypothetical protein
LPRFGEKFFHCNRHGASIIDWRRILQAMRNAP